MEQRLYEQALKEAVRIGDELLTTAQNDEHGLYWLAYKKNIDVFQWVEVDHLYSGNSGIALFLLELYRMSGYSRFLDGATESLRRIEQGLSNKPDKLVNGSFITGALSVPYLLKRFYEITGDRGYLMRGIDWARSVSFNMQGAPLEYLNGLSGTLLAFLHLYTYAEDPILLKRIKEITTYLINGINVGKKGFYWDRMTTSTHPLCGLSHGASGIAFVFLELGKLFDQDAFFWIAEQAFIYEDQHFNIDRSAWRDLRHGIFTTEDEQQFESAYKKGDRAYFKKHKYMNAWCHGAAGIGLVRARAYAYTHKGEYLNQVLMASSITYSELFSHRQAGDPISFTLCHGAGGNADIFVEQGELPSEKNRSKEHRLFMLEYALDEYRKYEYYLSGISTNVTTDPSLFMGNAGVGYFYLRMLDPESTPSILAPRMTRQKNKAMRSPFLDITEERLKEQVIERYFPQTYVILKYYLSAEAKRYFRSQRNNTDFVNSWCLFAGTGIPDTLPNQIIGYYKAVFRFEKMKLTMHQSVDSDSLFSYRQKRVAEEKGRLLQLVETDTLSNLLQFNQDMMLLESPYIILPKLESAKMVDVASVKISSRYLLFLERDFQVRSIQLDDLSYEILKMLSEPKTVADILERINSLYNPENESDYEKLKNLVKAQLVEAINAGVLIDSIKQSLSSISVSIQEPSLNS